MFRRWFGGAAAATPAAPAVAAEPPAVAATPVAATPGAVVLRDEAIGARARLLGYRVAVRGAHGATADSGAWLAALAEEQLPRLAARRLVVLPLRAAQWAEADFASLVGAQTVVLLGDEAGADATAAVAAIRASGASVALAAPLLERAPELAAEAGAVLLDASAYAFERLVDRLASLRAQHPQLALWLDRVGSWSEYRLLLDHGASLCFGGFVTLPDDDRGAGRLGESRLVLVEMLAQLRRDADPEVLEEVAKRDPGVAMKLLEIANSPLAGLSRPVASLHQAFLVLGRDALARWLALGLYRSGDDPRDETLLELALTRARFLELVAQRCGARADELFLVGMFSLLDSLLGLPMAEVVGRLQLPPVVSDVLLRSEGAHAPFLRLALLVERDRGDAAAALAATLGIEADALSACRSIAFLWTQESLPAR